MVSVHRLSPVTRYGDERAQEHDCDGGSQQDLAARCNFEKSNMSRIEYGRSNVTVGTLLTISRALGVRLRDLVDVESENP